MLQEKWVIDSNAFIHIGQRSDSAGIKAIIGVLRHNNQRLIITNGVRKEIQRVKCQRLKNQPFLLNELKNVIQEQKVLESQIRGLGEKLGESASPQDVDLSLMVLAAEMGRSENNILLVSDDFKMAKGARTLALPYRTCPPSTFIHKLSRLAGKQHGETLEELARSIRAAEMRYTIQRAGTYNADAKLSWMIDSLLADETKEIEKKSDDDGPSERKLIRAITNYIEGKKVKQSHIVRIQDLLDVVEPLKLPLEAAKNNPSYDLLDEILIKSRIELGMALAPLEENKGDLVRKSTSSILWRLEATLGILALESNNKTTARRHLAQALETAAIADDNEGEHHALMHLALIELGGDDASQSHRLFTAAIAESEDNQTKIPATLGAAMAAWMCKNEAKAEEQIEQVRILIEEDEAKAIEPLMNLARSLRSIGYGVLALEVYDEALECAVEANKMLKANEIVNRMSLIDTSVSDSHQDRLALMIDRINSIDGEEARLFEAKLTQLGEH